MLPALLFLLDEPTRCRGYYDRESHKVREMGRGRVNTARMRHDPYPGGRNTGRSGRSGRAGRQEGRKGERHDGRMARRPKATKATRPKGTKVERQQGHKGRKATAPALPFAFVLFYLCAFLPFCLFAFFAVPVPFVLMNSN